MGKKGRKGDAALTDLCPLGPQLIVEVHQGLVLLPSPRIFGQTDY